MVANFSFGPDALGLGAFRLVSMPDVMHLRNQIETTINTLFSVI